PAVVVAMGATAAQSMLGPAYRLTQHRGEFVEGTRWGPLVTATIHPSAVLRAPDDAARRSMFEGLVADLRLVAARLHGAGARVAAGRTAQGPVRKQAEAERPRRKRVGRASGP